MHRQPTESFVQRLLQAFGVIDTAPVSVRNARRRRARAATLRAA